MDITPPLNSYYLLSQRNPSVKDKENDNGICKDIKVKELTKKRAEEKRETHQTDQE